MKSRVVCLALCATMLSMACASTSTPSVDPSESFRVVGRENDVRIDAQLHTRQIGPSSPVSLVYEVRNLSSHPIMFAPIEPTVAYHADSRTITVGLGAEIPVVEALPAMVSLAPGETRSFTAGAALKLAVPNAIRSAHPRFIQVRFNYLRDPAGIEGWIDSSTVASEPGEGLFRTWVEHIASVVTNALPIRWGGRDQTGMPAVDASRRFPQ
jgi:hypothetical protein